MSDAEPCLFALGASVAYGERIAGRVGLSLSDHEEREFEDGEHKARPLVNVRGRDVFVVHSLHGDAEQSANDKLCRLLFFIGALKHAAAARVTAVLPYLCYARKDRKTKPRDPVTVQYVARLIEAVGTDRVMTLDVHNLAAYQNAFRIGAEHLETRKLFADYVAAELGDREVAVVSPDVGGIKRAELFRETLETHLGRPAAAAFMEKHRSGGVVSGEALVGEVGNCTAVIIDDLISTGTTMARAARALRKAGAARVLAMASHGLFVGDAAANLGDPAIERVVVTDTVPPFRLDPAVARDKLVVLDAAELFAEAIRRVHGGGSIVELLEP